MPTADGSLPPSSVDAGAACLPGLPCLGDGLGEPVADSQRVFRVVLDALSRPGTLHPLPISLGPPPPLFPWTGALALALCDLETPVWLDAALGTETVRAWLRFHAGCPVVTTPEAAAFALVGDSLALDDLSRFAIGSAEYPDRSATVVAQVAALRTEETDPAGWVVRGPGLQDTARLGVDGLATGFADAWRDNAALYPQGVDVFFASPKHLVGLPRSVMLSEADTDPRVGTLRVGMGGR